MLNNIIERIRLPFREDRELRSALYDIIGFYPRKMRYYKLALMHKSVGHRAVIENEGKGKKGQAKRLGHKVNNERLEFLGDGSDHTTAIRPVAPDTYQARGTNFNTIKSHPERWTSTLNGYETSA